MNEQQPADKHATGPGMLLAMLEANINQLAIDNNLTIVEIIGVMELFKHQMLSEAKETYDQQVKKEQLKKEVDYFG